MNQRGFVLLTTLFVIMMLSYLMISYMQSLLIYQKISHELIEKEQRLHAMERAALNLYGNQSCRVTESSPNELVDALKHHRGCIYQSNLYKYEYLISDLGDFPCLVSHHWLVSILETEHPGDILQIRIASPIIHVQPCESLHIQNISLGVISWRLVQS